MILFYRREKKKRMLASTKYFNIKISFFCAADKQVFLCMSSTSEQSSSVSIYLMCRSSRLRSLFPCEIRQYALNRHSDQQILYGVN